MKNSNQVSKPLKHLNDIHVGHVYDHRSPYMDNHVSGVTFEAHIIMNVR